jgi:hypothetical protein
VKVRTDFRLIITILLGANELNFVTSRAQPFNKSRNRKGNTVYFRWIRLSYERHSKTRQRPRVFMNRNIHGQAYSGRANRVHSTSVGLTRYVSVTS